MIKIKLNESKKLLLELLVKNLTGKEKPTSFYFKVIGKEVILGNNFDGEEKQEKSSYGGSNTYGKPNGRIDLLKKEMILYVIGEDTWSANALSAQSPEIKKVVRQFGVKRVRTEIPNGAHGPEEQEHKPNDSAIPTYVNPKEQLPKIGFSGRSHDNILKIYKLGLAPRNVTKANSNFKAMHDNTIFFSADYKKALAYSRGYPKCVFEFKIPDQAKIIPDYDARGAGGEKGTNYTKGLVPGEFDDIGYKQITGHTSNFDQNQMSDSKQMGLFGYIGRIPSNHIMYVYINGKKYPFAKYCQSLINKSKKEEPSEAGRGRIR